MAGSPPSLVCSFGQEDSSCIPSCIVFTLMDSISLSLSLSFYPLQTGFSQCKVLLDLSTQVFCNLFLVEKRQ